MTSSGTPEKLRVIYDNAGCLVCIKPAGIPSEGDGVSMVSMLSAQTGKQIYPVHRLDTQTSGAMVFAYKQEEAARLSRLIQEKKEFRKEYLAIVEGRPENAGGVFEDLLYFDRSKNKSFVVTKARSGVKEASLEYCAEGTAEYEGKPCTLVRIVLHTGRTHQIRVQFASRGMPVAGDRRYGSHLKCPLALHSFRIGFPDKKGNMLMFEAERPSGLPWELFE